jgi:hypothetical protein
LDLAERTVRIRRVLSTSKGGLFILLKPPILEKRQTAMQMNFHRKLPIPQEVKKEFPLTERMEKVKAERDENIKAVFFIKGGFDFFSITVFRT